MKEINFIQSLFVPVSTGESLLENQVFECYFNIVYDKISHCMSLHEENPLACAEMGQRE